MLEINKEPKEYYKRKPGESSTSNYIQVNTTNKNDGAKGQDRLGETPDTKIIIPQMKKDINVVKALGAGGGGLLAALMAALGSFVSSLMPKPIKKEVAETKPTGEKAKYGSIVVKENDAGFVEIRDETPGNVRRIDLHPTGTYDTMLHNGDREDKTTGKKLTMVDKNWEVVVFQNEIVVINKDSKIHIKENSFTNINGNQDINVDKNLSQLVNKDKKVHVKNNNSVKVDANDGLSVGKSRKETIGVDDELKVGKNKKETVGGNRTESVGGSLVITVSGNCTISARGPVNITSSSKVNVRAPRVSIA